MRPGVSIQQLNLRVARGFKIGARTQIEAIGEVFNLFNSENPDGFVTRRYTGPTPSPAPNPTFMQPTTFAGDFRQPEQRVGQLGLRFTF